MASYFYDRRDSEKTNFVHMYVGEEWEIGLKVEPDLHVVYPRIVVDNPAVGQFVGITGESLFTPNSHKVKLKGTGSGNCLVHARDPADGSEICYTQIVVRAGVSPNPIILDTQGSNITTRLDVAPIASRKNAQLLMTINLHLVQSPSGTSVTDSNGKAFVALDWTTAEWSNFTKQVKLQGERFFNNKFWLRTPNQYFPLVKDGVRYHVDCKLQINIVPSPVVASTTINVIKLLPKDQFNFRSNSGQFQIFDIQNSGAALNGVIYSHNTVLHELTHVMGEDHIGTQKGVPGCTSGNQGANKCYGITPKDFANVAGGGLRLGPINANPWRRRAAAHTATGVNEWAVSMKQIKPEVLN